MRHEDNDKDPSAIHPVANPRRPLPCVLVNIAHRRSSMRRRKDCESRWWGADGSRQTRWRVIGRHARSSICLVEGVVSFAEGEAHQVVPTSACCEAVLRRGRRTPTSGMATARLSPVAPHRVFVVITTDGSAHGSTCRSCHCCEADLHQARCQPVAPGLAVPKGPPPRRLRCLAQGRPQAENGAPPASSGTVLRRTPAMVGRAATHPSRCS